jgi:uncharacterized protein YcaQ
MTTLTIEQARNIQLATLGLSRPWGKPAVKEDILQAIRDMGALQIDTIHVVARSPYLVLWSRLGEYRNEWLDELLAEGAIFEYWAHAACFLPIENYPIWRRMMMERLHGWWNAGQWVEEHRPVVERVLEEIRQRGPLRSADFENTNHQTGGWWDWKEEKIALENLFTMGDLMIARREKFQRIYDLRERVLPDWDDAKTLSFEESKRILVERTVSILGVTQAQWVADYFRLPKTGIPALLDEMVEQGRLLCLEVAGWEKPAFLHKDRQDLLEMAVSGSLEPTHTTVLSPFDPLVWDRARLKAMFGFDYNIECYLPAQKRRYGYFSLPILHQGALVGRFDAKAHRKQGIFEVKTLFLEPGVQLEQVLASSLARALQNLADWHNTPVVQIRHSDPASFIEMLLDWFPQETGPSA